MEERKAHISITVLDTIYDDGTAEKMGISFEELAENYANSIAKQIDDEGFAVNDIEIHFC